MSVLSTILGSSIVSKAVDWVSDWFTTRRETKRAEAEMKMKLAEAKTQAQIDLYKTGLVGDIAWEKNAQDNSGWKDEMLVIVFSLPLIGGFIPGLDVYIDRGFHAFDSMPDWYQASIGVIVASVFGVRKFSEFMSMKKGVNLSRIDEIKELLQHQKELNDK